VYADVNGRRRSAGTWATEQQARRARQKAEDKISGGCLSDARRGRQKSSATRTAVATARPAGSQHERPILNRQPNAPPTVAWQPTAPTSERAGAAPPVAAARTVDAYKIYGRGQTEDRALDGVTFVDTRNRTTSATSSGRQTCPNGLWLSSSPARRTAPPLRAREPDLCHGDLRNC
jgi:hypothetical protein